MWTKFHRDNYNGKGVLFDDKDESDQCNLFRYKMFKEVSLNPNVLAIFNSECRYVGEVFTNLLFRHLILMAFPVNNPATTLRFFNNSGCLGGTNVFYWHTNKNTCYSLSSYFNFLTRLNHIKRIFRFEA